MIKAFPEEWELLGFFECEPRLRDPGFPWLYNTIHFTTSRGALEVRCTINGSYGKLSVALFQGGIELLDLRITEADGMRILSEKGKEILEITFDPKSNLETCFLQLKPQVWVGWGNRRSARGMI